MVQGKEGFYQGDGFSVRWKWEKASTDSRERTQQQRTEQRPRRRIIPEQPTFHQAKNVNEEPHIVEGKVLHSSEAGDNQEPSKKSSKKTQKIAFGVALALAPAMFAWHASEQLTSDVKNFIFPGSGMIGDYQRGKATRHLLQAGGYAGLGAIVGSFFPGIGTAGGALLGAAVPSLYRALIHTVRNYIDAAKEIKSSPGK